MKIVFLGTNGWYDTSTGNTICILIDTSEYHIILDAGNGFHKIDRYINDEKPIYLFLSHFHLEHIIGLHILNKFNFTQGVKICGQKGTKDILNIIINQPYTMPLSGLSYSTEIIELPEEREKLPFYVDSKPLLHSSLTLGFRIEIDGKVIAYCPDTGYCENAVELARHADLLIAECAYKSGQSIAKWLHLNPDDAARIAVEARAKRLALTHFDASIYRTVEERKEAEKQGQKVFENTFAAMDDIQIEI